MRPLDNDQPHRCRHCGGQLAWFMSDPPGAPPRCKAECRESVDTNDPDSLPCPRQTAIRVQLEDIDSIRGWLAFAVAAGTVNVLAICYILWRLA